MGKTLTLTIEEVAHPLGKPMGMRYNMKVINQRDDTA